MNTYGFRLIIRTRPINQEVERVAIVLMRDMHTQRAHRGTNAQVLLELTLQRRFICLTSLPTDRTGLFTFMQW